VFVLVRRLLPLLLASSATAATPGGADDDGRGREVGDAGCETVVLGHRDGSEPSADPAAASSVVTLDRPPRSGETVADLLAELPGVAVNRMGGLGSMALMSVRGSTWEQVRVLVDGVPLSSATGGGVDLSTIPLGDIERIEVYRGSSPLSLGASALGGIVFITTRAPRDSRASAHGGLGSFGATKAGASGSLAGTVGVYAGAAWESALNAYQYFSNHGTAFDPSDDGFLTRQNGGYRQLSATTRAVWRLSARRQLSVVASGFDRQQGLPGFGLYPTTAASLGVRRILASAAYRSTGDFGEGSKVEVLSFLGWGTTRLRDLLGEVVAGNTDTIDTTWTLGLTASAHKRLGLLRLAGLVELRWERFIPRDEVRSPPVGAPASRFSFASGVETGLRLEALHLDVIPSARLEGAFDAVAGRDVLGGFAPASPPRWRTQPVARLALLWRPHPEWTVKANLGRYARLANFTELYGDSGFIIGNPALRPELGTTADLGVAGAWRAQGATFRAELFGFASFVGDLIQYQQSGSGVSRAANVGQARILGAEVLAQAELGRWVRLSGQLTFTDARDTTQVAAHLSKQLPLRPRAHADLRVELRRVPLLWGLEGGAFVEGDATEGNFLDPANFVRLPPRFLLGAGLNLSWPHARVVFSARNLTDSRISDFGGYPLPGRSFFVTLTLSTHDVRTESEP
jgi:iron complex outermembrane receptor protein